MTWGQKKSGIYLGLWNPDRRNTKLNMIPVFGEKIKTLSSKQPKLNRTHWLHPKIAFVCRLLTQTTTWWPNHTILTSSVIAILKAMSDTFFWGPSFWWSAFLIYVGWFLQRERVFWCRLAGPSHIDAWKGTHTKIWFTILPNLASVAAASAPRTPGGLTEVITTVGLNHRWLVRLSAVQAGPSVQNR